jgi:hypothetical protein
MDLRFFVAPCETVDSVSSVPWHMRLDKEMTEETVTEGTE